MDSCLDLDVDVQIQVQSKFEGIFAATSRLLLAAASDLAEGVSEKLACLPGWVSQGLVGASTGEQLLVLLLRLLELLLLLGWSFLELLLLWWLGATTAAPGGGLGLGRRLSRLVVVLPLLHGVGRSRA